MTDARIEEETAEAFDATGFAADFRERFEALPASRRFTAEQLEVLYGMAYAHAQQRQWSKALPLFAFLAQYGPTRRHYLAGLALCMRELGRYEEAKNVYALMLLLFPEQMEPGLYVAECQLAQGEMAAAQKTLSQLAELLEETAPLKARVLALLQRVSAKATQPAA